MQYKNIERLQQKVDATGIRFSMALDNMEVARAYLYVMKNDLHEEPFGLLEDVFIIDEFRGAGIGTELVNSIIAKAEELGCYKLIATSRSSRPRVHALYQKLGFANYGLEFRKDFERIEHI